MTYDKIFLNFLFCNFLLILTALPCFNDSGLELGQTYWKIYMYKDTATYDTKNIWISNWFPQKSLTHIPNYLNKIKSNLQSKYDSV